MLSGFSNIVQNDLIEAIGDAIRYDLKEIRVDIVGPFKLPSVDVCLGANEAPGDAFEAVIF